MIIAVVLAHEYPLVTGRLKFILQAASHARENDIFYDIFQHYDLSKVTARMNPVRLKLNWIDLKVNI